MQQLCYYLLHIDKVFVTLVAIYGLWSYLALFIVIFCETGLIIAPFLPGDSLLFTVGSFAAQPNSPLNIMILFISLTVASVLGNQVNYLIGRFIGPRVFNIQKSRLFNKKHLEQAHQFYEKHGGKTIILARFIPIIRTFVPFIAGVSYMSLPLYSLYNSSSAILWIGSLLGLGYFFGTLPIINDHFSIVIYGVILLSLLPPVIVFLANKLWLPTVKTNDAK